VSTSARFLALAALLCVASPGCKKPEAQVEKPKSCAKDSDCGASGFACIANQCLPAFNISGAAPSASESAAPPDPSAAAAAVPTPSTSAAPSK